MRTLTIFWLIIFFSKAAFPFSVIDSVDHYKKQINVLPANEKIKPILKLAEIYGGNQPKLMFAQASKALKMAIETKQDLFQAKALLIMAKANGILGNQQKVFPLLNRANIIFTKQKDITGKLDVIIQNGLAHQKLGNLIKSKAIVKKGLTLAIKHNRSSKQLELLLDLSRTLIMQGLGREAEEKLNLAKILAKTLNNSLLSARLELNLGSLYCFLGAPIETRKHLTEALKHAKETDDLQLLGICYLQLSDLDSKEVNCKISEQYLNTAKSISLSTGNRHLQLLVKKRESMFPTLNNTILKDSLLNECIVLSETIEDKWNSVILKSYLSGVNENRFREGSQLDIYLNILEESIEKGYFLEQINAYIFIGYSYVSSNDIDKAEEYFLKAINLSKKLEYSKGEQMSTLAYGKVFMRRSDMNQCMIQLNDALKIAQSSNHFATVVSIKSIIALIYSEQNNMATSLRLIKEVLDVKKVLELDSRISQAAYRFAGQIYYKVNTKLSIKYFKKCLSICEKLESNLELEFCYAYLAIIYEQDKNYSEALFYQKKLEVLKADMYKEQLDLEVEELQTKFETEQKEQEIETLEKEQAYQKLEVEKQGVQLKQQRQNILSIIFGFVLLLSVSILLFNRYRLKQKNEKLLLQTQQLGLEKQQKETEQQLEISEMRTDFFTNVSHEFRTPLTLILGPLENLLKRENITDRTSIEGIYRNANSLLTLVNETLDLSKVEYGHLPLVIKRLNLSAFILKIGQTFAPLSETQNIKLEIIDESENCLVDFDPRKLEKVLVNLLGNAFKYSASGNDIFLFINHPEENSISIQVKDSGEGIDSEHLPHIFNRFYQVNQKSKGSGVGLALTKQLVELHNGTITVSSLKGIGSVLTVTLPLIQHASNEVKDISIENNNEINTQLIDQNETAQSKTVLIIEDHDEVREYLKSLMLDNYHVITARDGQEGVSLAEQNNPDLIISDIMMPYQSGLELTRHLKQNLQTSHIPIILLTAKASLENKIEGLEVGADDYLSKPFHIEELLKRCENLIQTRVRLRELFSTHYYISPTKLSNNEVDQSFLENAINIVENHLTHADFNVEMFCQQLAHNRSGVHIKLKALTGKNTTQFIKSIRLRHAAKLIQETSQNMTEISNMVGFGSRQAFNKAFKEQFKLTPTEFRGKDGFVSLNRTFEME